MKIIVNVLFVVAIALFAVSCNKNDVTSLEKAKSDVELRAQQLGFEQCSGVSNESVGVVCSRRSLKL